MFAFQRGLGYMLMNAIGLHNVDVIMAVTFVITVLVAAVSGILLATAAGIAEVGRPPRKLSSSSRRGG
jgi:ABC-type nitrate/sulfonate/bicarbonate transport system permease component